MSDYTPDSLRGWASVIREYIYSFAGDSLDAHADAWEADRQARSNDVVRLNEANAKIVRQAEVIAKLETSRIALQADNAALIQMVVIERECEGCWKGVSCGRDCQMNDVAALASQPELKP
jgi:hypothetical protein